MGQSIQDITSRKEWFGLSSPIGVIGAFAALVEVALILGSIFVEGNFRWAMLGFAFLAFAYITSWFFYILSRKNWVLYPPREYGGETEVATYVEAMRATISEAGKPEQVVTTYTIGNLTAVDGTSVEILNAQGSQANLLVFMGPAAPNSLGLPIDFEQFHSVTDCLAYIGNTLLPPVETEDDTENKRRHDMNYGTSWILRDLETQLALLDIGARWTYHQTGNLSDMRRLKDTSLKPGMRLEVVRLRAESLPIQELLADDERILREEPPLPDDGAAK
jgi:hypothetical protein